MVEENWSLQKKQFLLVAVKALFLYFSEKYQRLTFIATPFFPYCKLLSRFLTGNCILQNISQNTVALWVTVFYEIFRKKRFAIFTHI